MRTPPPATGTDGARRTRAERAAVSLPSARLHGWGRGPGSEASLLRARDGAELSAAVELYRSLVETDGRRRWAGLIPRGMGRSYGDAAQLRDGLVLETLGLDGFELDRETGVVTAGAGATIAQLLEHTVPRGWMVPVVPGTQHVSVGGAIASDIHGKNHGTAGTFGRHVEALGLLKADGEAVEISPGDEEGLFAATIGGMGLTGVILWAKIRHTAVSSSFLSVDTDRVRDLDEALQALREPGGPHRVAWLDLLGSRPGRGIVTRAAHVGGDAVSAGARGAATVGARGAATVGARGAATVGSRATVPSRWPAGVLRPGTVRAFNELRFRTAPARERGRIEGIGSHMFPLDALDAWPRLYGPLGFLQYQLVVPYGAERVLQEVIEGLRRARIPVYLTVLKDFGPANDAPLSFPIAGWTITLDVPRSAGGLEPVLDRFDEVVAQAGGRVYLSKDSRMRPEALRAMYPRLGEWQAARDRADPDGVWRSDLAVRTGLVCGGGRTPGVAPHADLAAGPAALANVASGPAGATPERRVLLIGGTSEIGLAIVRRLSDAAPVRPFLLGRDRDRLAGALAALEALGCARGEHDAVDADDLASHEEAIGRAFDRFGGFDVVVLAIGVLGAQAGLDADRAEAAEVMRVDFLGSGSLLLAALRRLRAQGHGTLVVLSSVAAERPRASNAVYGAAKTGLDALAQGLADATADSGVRVLVVRPGFVKTRMTAGLKPTPFATDAEAVADATVRGLDKEFHTVWVPGALRYVFAALRHLPRPIYRRLPL